MTIYLIRHGETDWNQQNRLQGVEDIELNETGALQSQECARAFIDIPVNRILTSPLKRAKATADIIADIIKAGPVIIESGLTERDFGKLSGLTLREREALLAGNVDPGMEPKEALTERLMAVINNYTKNNNEDVILVVSHGASINAILSHISGGEIGSGKTILKNTCVSRLTCDGNKFDIDFYNLTPAEFRNMKR